MSFTMRCEVYDVHHGLSLSLLSLLHLLAGLSLDHHRRERRHFGQVPWGS